jgi:hypothetical protein
VRDVGGVQSGGSKPAANHRHVDACCDQTHRRGVTKGVRGHSLASKRTRLSVQSRLVTARSSPYPGFEARTECLRTRKSDGAIAVDERSCAVCPVKCTTAKSRECGTFYSGADTATNHCGKSPLQWLRKAIRTGVRDGLQNRSAAVKPLVCSIRTVFRHASTITAGNIPMLPKFRSALARILL